MAHIQRLILAVVLCLLTVTANAFPPSQRGYFENFGTTLHVKEDAPALAQANWAGSPDRQVYLGGYVGNNYYYCSARVGHQEDCPSPIVPCDPQYGACYRLTFIPVGNICPVNSQIDTNGDCKCNATYAEVNGACQKPDECKNKQGQLAGSNWWVYNAGYGDAPTGGLMHQACDMSGSGERRCVVDINKSVCARKDGRWKCEGPGTYSGSSVQLASCVGFEPPIPPDKPPPTPPAEPAKPSPCPPGQSPGEVNGQQVCAASGPNGASGEPRQSNSSSSSTASDGTRTDSATQTNCQGGTCSTTTTETKTPAGGGVSTSSSTTIVQSSDDLCKKEPTNKLCKGTKDGGESSFSGSCASGFQAKGDDAVLNAMAQETFSRNCETLRTDAPESTAIRAIMDKTGDLTADNPNNSNVEVNSGLFDTSSALGSGTCSLDKTITVRGRSVTLPFNDLCDPLAALGGVLVAVSMLLAGRIVTRG